MREFQSFRGFASHLAMLAATGEEVTSFAAKEGAKIVADDAKARIGEYQDGVGPYGAWANLAPSTIDDRLSKGFTPDDPLLRSGELWNSIVVVSQGNVAGAVTPDMVALWQEEGTNTIPPRPFLGPAAFTSKEKIGKRIGETVIAWICGVGWKNPRIKL